MIRPIVIAVTIFCAGAAQATAAYVGFGGGCSFFYNSDGESGGDPWCSSPPSASAPRAVDASFLLNGQVVPASFSFTPPPDSYTDWMYFDSDWGSGGSWEIAGTLPGGSRTTLLAGYFAAGGHELGVHYSGPFGSSDDYYADLPLIVTAADPALLRSLGVRGSGRGAGGYHAESSYYVHDGDDYCCSVEASASYYGGVTMVSTPEPQSAALSCLGLLGVMCCAVRKRVRS